MSQIKGVIANVDSGDDVWTDEAIASLVGQRPTFTIAGDFTKPVGKGTVIAAERRDNDVVVTYEVSEEGGRRIRDLLGPNADGEPHTGIGYYVDKARHETGAKPIRYIEGLRLVSVGRAVYSPEHQAIVERVAREGDR